jgi:hypothetical protein
LVTKQLTSVGRKFAALFDREWKTKDNKFPLRNCASSCKYEMEGFAGLYKLTATQGRNELWSKEIMIEERKTNTVTVEI